MATRIQVRRGTTSQWNTANPTLEEGEIGYNSTLGQIKVGDGTSVWADLDYFVSDTSLGTSLGTYLQDSDKSAVNGVAELDASKNILAPASIIFEGTADAHETTLAVTDPTADRTITFPDATGTVITTGNLSDITNIGVFSSTITMEGSTANDFELTLSAGDPTADRTITFPDATGTVALTTDIAVTESSTTTFTNKTLTSPKINEDVVMSATATELNILDGATLSTTELNYVDGVTSAIQTQIDLKAPLASPTFTGTVALPSTVNGPNTTTSVNLLSTSTSANITLGTQQTSGNLTIGGGSARTTGIVGIATGATASGTKTIDIGTGSTGGTTAITIGSSSGATSNITLNGTVTAANNLVITGDLTVNGTTTTVNSTTVNVSNAFVFEGTANDFETTLTITDPTADRTITLPDATGTVQLRVTDVDDTEIGYLNGVTSAIQTQLDGKVDESLFDVKGDILVASADNTPAKLGVGTNGYILTANSSATNGIEWAAAPISLPSQTGNSGKYLTTDGSTASWGTVSSYSAPTIGSTSIASGATVTTIAGLTLSNATLSGSLTAGGGTGTSGQVLASTGSGVQWSTPSAGAAFSEFMLIGC